MFTFTGTFSSHIYDHNHVHGTIEIQLPYFYIHNFTTTMTMHYDGVYRNGQTQTFELEGTFKETFNQDPIYTLNSRIGSMNQTFTMILIEHGEDINVFEGYYSTTRPIDTGTIKVKCTETCQGCLEMQPNQLAHTDYGGCLYNLLA